MLHDHPVGVAHLNARSSRSSVVDVDAALLARVLDPAACPTAVRVGTVAAPDRGYSAFSSSATFMTDDLASPKSIDVCGA